MKLSFVLARRLYCYSNPVILFINSLNFFLWKAGVKDLLVGFEEGVEHLIKIIARKGKVPCFIT
jgi:hypothetical protein